MPRPFSTPAFGDDQLKYVSQLHEAMSLVRDAEESLRTILRLLRNIEIPWPTVRDLKVHTEDLERAQGLLSDAEMSNLTRDLGIWITEHYYAPKTLAEVKQLKSGLRQGGFEYLLRCCWKKEGASLRERDDKWLYSVFEKWIEFIWQTDITDLTQTLEKDGVITTGHFIGWLDKNCFASSDSSLNTVMERLKQLAP
jgi:hypothetical protein